MGFGQTGALCYIDENGNAVQVSAANPLPPGVQVFVTEIVADEIDEG